jgi:hypothetical protein
MNLTSRFQIVPWLRKRRSIRPLPHSLYCVVLNQLSTGTALNQMSVPNALSTIQSRHIAAFCQRKGINCWLSPVSKQRTNYMGYGFTNGLEQWYSTGWGGVRENILRNLFNLEPALILALRKIRPGTEVLECQKQAQSSQ